MSYRGKNTILLASANSTVLSSIKNALESGGLTVSIASTIGETAAAIARDTPIGLLIVDHAFLLHSEFKLAESEVSKRSVVPLLVLCSINEPLVGQIGTDIPIYGFIDRDMRADLLVRSVKTALRLHSPSDPSKRRRDRNMALPGLNVPAKYSEFSPTNRKSDGLSFDLYRTLLDATDDIAYIKDEKLRYVTLNRASLNFFGKPERDLVGKTDSVLLGKDAAKMRMITDRQAMRLNRPLMSVETINGRVYESRKFPVPLEGGGTGIGPFMRDITETRRAEERLLASEKKLYLRNRIAQLFLTVPGDEIYDGILEVVREMLKSRLGIFGYIDSQGRLVHASVIGMSDGSCGVTTPNRDHPHSAAKGLLARCLVDGHSFYCNEGPSTPAGHPALSNAICSPVMYGDRPIGIITLANRPGGYDDRDMEDLEEMVRYIAPLLFSRMEYTRKEAERRAAEQKIGKFSSDMAFLSRTAMGFIDMPEHLNIYEYIARSLEELLPGFRILVNEFESEDGTTVVRAVAGEKGVLDSVIKLLGRSPVGVRTPMPPEHQKELLCQQLQIGPDGFYELSGRTLPELVCRAIDRLLDIGTVYGMGFARQDILYGNVLLIAPRGTSLEDTSIIEAFVKQASVALQRHRAELELARSLREKESLLRELQHRVKNSLSIITSLVTLEIDRTRGRAPAAQLGRIRDRIATLSDLYALLNDSQGGDRLRLDSFVERIVRALVSAHIEQGRQLSLHFSMVPVSIDFNRAVSLGIIVNELVTNSIKHAFSQEGCGTLRITLELTEGALTLGMLDDGPGLPGDFDISAPPGLGLGLVRVLAGELGGRVEFSREPETRFSVRVPFP